MDSIEVTLRRTAAATALAVQYLAPKAPRCVLMIGCGAQAPAHLDALRALGDTEGVDVYDQNPAAARHLAKRYANQFRIETVEAGMLQRHARAATVIVTCTTAQTPVLSPNNVVPGTLICAVGADAAHKNEIAPALMSSSRVVVDSLTQCAAFGDLRHAIACGVMRETDVAASLSEIVSGRAKPRQMPTDFVVFDSTGVASQDAMAVIAILKRRAEKWTHRFSETRRDNIDLERFA